jgi:hypothetical protein
VGEGGEGRGEGRGGEGRGGDGTGMAPRKQERSHWGVDVLLDPTTSTCEGGAIDATDDRAHYRTAVPTPIDHIIPVNQK